MKPAPSLKEDATGYSETTRTYGDDPEAHTLYPKSHNLSQLLHNSFWWKTFQDDVGTDLPGVKKPGPQYHDGLTGALFQLHLDGREFLVDDLHHALYLLRRDWARPGLFPEEVHHMRRELVTCLQQNNTFVPDRIRFSSESHTHTYIYC